MLSINKYFSRLEARLETSSLVAIYTMGIDKKSDDIALISGKVEFRDGSVLNFKEFVENTGRWVQKYKYAYNYRLHKETIFRYDNAPDPNAKDLKTYPHHKHLCGGAIVVSRPVALNDVLDEIETVIISDMNQ